MSARAQELEAARAPLGRGRASACSGWRPRPRRSPSCVSGRDQEPVAAGDRRRRRRQGLREGARRRARRRSRCAGRPVGADALGRCRRRSRAIRRCPKASSRSPRMSMRPPSWRAAWRQIGVVAARSAARLVVAAQARPAAGVAGRRLWRWDGFVAAAHAPTGAARRLAERAGWPISKPRLNRPASTPTPDARPLEAAEAELKAASAAEAAAREAWRAAQREADAARDRHAATEREINRHAARKSALTEAQAASTPTATEAVAAHRGRAAALAELPPSLDTETRLAAVRADIDGQRAASRRGARRSAGAGARGGTRRPPAAGDRRRTEPAGSEPQGRRGLADRHARSPRHRGHSRARRTRQCAAALFAEKRRALISEIEAAEAARRVAADRAGGRRERAGGSRPRRQDFARGALEPRARTAPAPKSGSRAPSAASPTSSAKSTTCSKSSRTPWPASPRSSRGRSCRRLAEIEAKPGKAAPRARAARRGQSARRGGTARGRSPAHHAHDRARRSGRSDQAAAPGHPEPQPRGARAAAGLVRDGQRPFQAAVLRTVRRRRSRASADRERRSAGSRPRNHRQAARQEAADAVAAVRRRAGADRAGADLRGVPHQPVADLRAGRSRRAARRSQRRAVLRPAGRDDLARPRRASSSSPTIRSPWRG